MGIPSYYKKLISTIPGLVTKCHPVGSINWLFMDFNCLIYHCLHREDTPIYPGVNQRDEWEAQFLDCVVKYCVKVIKEVQPKSGVFIAIDGVVPMAKMRQQRLRRFKSAWLARNSENSFEPKWDTNAITPGTVFMKKLRTRLETMITKNGRSNWYLSSSDEPGEGEHKIIAEWRKGTYNGDFAVYGLDADLIVLSILGRECCKLNNNIWLFREEVDAGKISYDALGEEIFEWFSTNHLSDWLSSDFSSDADKKRNFILNYCFAMSVLGNDFLPSSLGLKIRDDGHSELHDIIRSFTAKNIPLIDNHTLNINASGILALFTTLAVEEETRIQNYIGKKRAIAYNITQNIEGGIKLGDNNWPLEHVEESVLINTMTRKLKAEWKNIYMAKFFNGFENTPNNIRHICKEYLYGIQWIWAYYTGRMNDVCFNWFYPFGLPPLWYSLCEYLKKTDGVLPCFPDNVRVRANDILPVEQLSLVLPLDSWSLIPQCPQKMLPLFAPQYFPETFDFDSVGKRYFWECEALIPIPNIYQIKTIIKLNT